MTPEGTSREKENENLPTKPNVKIGHIWSQRLFPKIRLKQNPSIRATAVYVGLLNLRKLRERVVSVAVRNVHLQKHSLSYVCLFVYLMAWELLLCWRAQTQPEATVPNAISRDQYAQKIRTILLADDVCRTDVWRKIRPMDWKSFYEAIFSFA